MTDNQNRGGMSGMFQKTSEQLLEFIKKSPSCFHLIQNMKDELKQNGFTELSEAQRWELSPGGAYFTTRGGSSLIAFRIPQQPFRAFRIMATHSDFPTFKLKANAEMTVEERYVKLNVEKYGGMICAPWFDRPLSIAGRVIVREENGTVAVKLADAGRDLVMIPNLAIHMNRDVNKGYEYNAQKDLLPLFGGGEAKGKLMEIIAESAGVAPGQILSHDLFLYNRMEGTVWGAENEFVSAPKLDDAQCAFASLKAFLSAENPQDVTVHCVLDNEEVGSGTKQGAASTFLKDVLRRINRGLGRNEEDYLCALALSFMLSADNAHAVHPNHADKADPTNRPYLNGGVVIKYSANQKYTTDAVSAAVFQLICEQAEVPYQRFANRSDMAGGSTLGNISNTQAALNTVDIGVAQLAMHSSYETCGVKDTYYMMKAAAQFFRSGITADSAGRILT